MCDEIDWQFFGLTMPEVMVGVFAAYLIALAYGLFGDLRNFRRRTGT
jgi:disulfide bond formation protein DsbB